MASQQNPTVGSRVLVSGGKKVGTVKALLNGGDGGQIVAITVEHGMIRRATTRVPMSAVKWVNPGSVILGVSAAQFGAFGNDDAAPLPAADDPAPQPVAHS